MLLLLVNIVVRGVMLLGMGMGGSFSFSSADVDVDVILVLLGLFEDLEVLVENVAHVARRPLHESFPVELAYLQTGNLDGNLGVEVEYLKIAVCTVHLYPPSFYQRAALCAPLIYM